jgi:hypothetical protein
MPRSGHRTSVRRAALGTPAAGRKPLRSWCTASRRRAGRGTTTQGRSCLCLLPAKSSGHSVALAERSGHRHDRWIRLRRQVSGGEPSPVAWLRGVKRPSSSTLHPATREPRSSRELRGFVLPAASQDRSSPGRVILPGRLRFPHRLGQRRVEGRHLAHARSRHREREPVEGLGLLLHLPEPGLRVGRVVQPARRDR